MEKFPDINALVRITNGKLTIDVITNKNGVIKDELTQLLTLRDVLMGDTLKNFEKNHQEKLAQSNTEYKLPKEGTY